MKNLAAPLASHVREIDLVSTSSESWCTAPVDTPYANAYLVGRYLHAVDWHLMRASLWNEPQSEMMVGTLLQHIIDRAAQITFPIDPAISTEVQRCLQRWQAWRGSEEFRYWIEDTFEERFDPAYWNDEFTRDIQWAVKYSVKWPDVLQIESLLQLGRWVDRGLRPLGNSWLWQAGDVHRPDALELAFRGVVDPTGSRPSEFWLTTVRRAAADADLKFEESLWASDAEAPQVVDRIDTHILAELERMYEQQYGRRYDSERPFWDAERKELWFCGVSAKQFTREATNQWRIIRAFEEDGWPELIDDPLPGGVQEPRSRLNQTIKDLNNKLIGLRFRGDGTGERIRWSPITASNSRGRRRK